MPPTRVALDPAAKELTQDEIIVRAEAFGAGAALGGGLIGAFIGSKVAESRQNTIHGTLAPFYASVDDYDFRSHYVQALSRPSRCRRRCSRSPTASMRWAPARA
ncbi:hypothetical protein F2P45_18135 [Massilia sp. CCM 8733]|uniref:Uncharacterized protein n=1 Tax=Massilia mucilaginosa TaxID=2609282 RepID=A0ABX0NVQ1_9BURK|nr:hypothetical protein [Massilia mucilaginosa]NHZ90925.1 hypothetical protein [Massilia mucilaginosa]